MFPRTPGKTAERGNHIHSLLTDLGYSELMMLPAMSISLILKWKCMLISISQMEKLSQLEFRWLPWSHEQIAVRSKDVIQQPSPLCPVSLYATLKCLNNFGILMPVCSFHKDVSTFVASKVISLAPTAPTSASSLNNLIMLLPPGSTRGLAVLLSSLLSRVEVTSVLLLSSLFLRISWNDSWKLQH